MLSIPTVRSLQSRLLRRLPLGLAFDSDFQWVALGILALWLSVALSRFLPFVMPIRFGLAVVYVLGVPGYCLTAALFPRRDDLDAIERFGLSIGLSIALVPVLALCLDLLPWGLRLTPILIADSSATLSFAFAAQVRRSRLPILTGEFGEKRGGGVSAWWRSLSPLEQRIHALVAFALLLGAASGAYVLAVPSPDVYTTEFYLLGKNGQANDFPRVTVPGVDLSTRIGIVNRERGAQTYRVQVWTTDTWRPGHRMLVAQSNAIAVPAGTSRQMTLSWRMPWVGHDQQVQFLLFQGDRQTPYRQLQLWIDVNPPTPEPVASPSLPPATATPNAIAPISTQVAAQPTFVATTTESPAPSMVTVTSTATPLPEVSHRTSLRPARVRPRVVPALEPTPAPTLRPVTAPSNPNLYLVPNLVGLSEADAQKAINDSGLMTTYVNYQTIDDVIYKEFFKTIAPGHVLSQEPKPGTAVPPGTRVALAVRKVVASDEQPSGVVASAAGRNTVVTSANRNTQAEPSAARSATIRPVKAPTNPNLLVVPNLVGLSEAKAQQAIRRAGFMTTYVNYQTTNDVTFKSYFNSIAPGHVVSQEVTPGTAVPPGTRIAIAVRQN